MDSLYLLAVDSTFNFCASYKVVDSESFNLYFLGFWASEFKDFKTLKPEERSCVGRGGFGVLVTQRVQYPLIKEYLGPRVPFRV